MNVRRLAELTGFSVATISRVVKGDPSVDSATREHVLHVLAQYPFYPDMKQKKRRVRNIFVFLAPHEATSRDAVFRSDVSFFSRAFSGVKARVDRAEACDNEQYYLLVVNYRSGRVIDKLTELQRLPYSKSIAGVFLIHSNRDDDQELSKYRGPFKIYALGRSPEEISNSSVDCVYFDNRMVGQLALQHLTDRGHTRVLVLSGSSDFHYLQLREAAFSQSEVPGIVVKNTTSNTATEAYDVLSEIWSASEAVPFTAIFATAEFVLKGVLEFFAAHKILIPHDVSVISTNDYLIAYQHDPPITVIRTPSYEIGHIAASVALANVAIEFPTTVRYCLGVMLNERGSVANLTR